MARIVSSIGTRPEIFRMVPIVKAFDRFRVPCLTLLENTEQPELDIGANVLAGTDPARVVATAKAQLELKQDWSKPCGDATTSLRTCETLDASVG
jgi:UDP-N-acetylglucosamine 2-epimerase